jgi:predicted  nucleic acid-binding Zn-ribbon protein
MPKTYDERFDRLEALIERGFAALAQDIADVKSELKADVADVREEIQAIRSELGDIRRRLEALEISIQNVSGFAKEIDHLLQRVGAIEQHLGIDRKIAV